ncbi:hypothetical protein M409DRAFT_62619 [Zasmidium cellare ATCC 36951]|uniref:DUF6314 domain-containing protein n=1 Tax=Zasmidium cellare ATCC 36951 TaxID=1080233 RepID=A0A6A6D460_ZASCE|nr:uncharacterized protein M409DRAFT_62619 [Zasmidium cellare ATCC 36951]KAF2172982.1 hypothetical protein M409DRAFT_62619 [Zasmidium cellare ATCC 36951]
MKSVAIVGAGPAGLTGAKVLLKTNKFNVTVFEKADRIGGIWALDERSTAGFLHPDTPTNLSRFSVAFSDLDWNSVQLNGTSNGHDQNGAMQNPKTPLFPKAWQVNKYLEAYRAKYIPQGTIRLRHEIIKAERLGQDGRPAWKLTIKDDQCQQTTSEFDYLMLGSGFFSTPRPLKFGVPEASLSNVRAIHSSQFRKLEDLFPRPEEAAGKSILVIGGGNSAGEAAAAVAQQLSNAQYSPETARQQTYRSCNIVHVAARPLYALPPYVPVEAASTTFMPIDLKLYDLSKRPPGPIVGNAGRVTKSVKDMIHTALQGTIGGNQSDLGTPALEIPADEPRSTVYVALSETYPEYVRSGLIEVVGGRVIALQDKGSNTATAIVKSSDGGKDLHIENIGAVVYATGYSPSSAVDFLDDEVKSALHYDPQSLRLPLILEGWQTAAAGIPELALLGFYEGPYWPMIEMQARYTAERWISESDSQAHQYEETEKLLDLRKTMQEKGLDVPQYWFGDYAGYMEEVSAHLNLERNNGAFATDREGCPSPARYLSADSDKAVADGIMQDLHRTWQDCREHGKFVARAAFRALQGNWNIRRTIDSALSSFPSGTLEGEASFHPRSPTPDATGLPFDLEYLYIESGVLFLSNGASMPAKRRYVYRYSEQRDELSVWFVKPDSDLEVDYLFHNLAFVAPSEAEKQGACIAKADHLCVEDMYTTEYKLPLKGISLHKFETIHRVRGPSKDYISTTQYSRPVKK